MQSDPCRHLPSAGGGLFLGVGCAHLPLHRGHVGGGEQCGSEKPDRRSPCPPVKVGASSEEARSSTQSSTCPC